MKKFRAYNHVESKVNNHVESKVNNHVESLYKTLEHKFPSYEWSVKDILMKTQKEWMDGCFRSLFLRSVFSVKYYVLE